MEALAADTASGLQSSSVAFELRFLCLRRARQRLAGTAGRQVRETAREEIVTLGDLGNVGEFVGAIAVVITLTYLAVQIRQNSSTTRAHIRQSLALDPEDWRCDTRGAQGAPPVPPVPRGIHRDRTFVERSLRSRSPADDRRAGPTDRLTRGCN